MPNDELLHQWMGLVTRIEGVRAALAGPVKHALTAEEQAELEGTLATLERNKCRLEEMMRGAGGTSGLPPDRS